MRSSAFSALKPPVLERLEKEGFLEASPIQELAIPAILSGENVLLIAPTGTGKTLAAILPVLDKLIEARAEGKPRGISVLYVTPLRALNRDLLRRLEEMGKDLDIKIQVRHGDTPISARTRQAKSPPDVMITTPETLQAILIGKRMKEHLRSVRWVVVDEVHELATDERGVQLSFALERLRELTGVDFQRIGLSATIGEPERIGQFLVGRPERIRQPRPTGINGLSGSNDTRHHPIPQVNPRFHQHTRARGGVSCPDSGNRGRNCCPSSPRIPIERVAGGGGERIPRRQTQSPDLHKLSRTRHRHRQRRLHHTIHLSTRDDTAGPASRSKRAHARRNFPRSHPHDQHGRHTRIRSSDPASQRKQAGTTDHT